MRIQIMLRSYLIYGCRLEDFFHHGVSGTLWTKLSLLFGLLQKIDWASVFRNCAEVVRVRISCKDLEKVPATRLYNLHGKLF
jgi:hypothetical protein